MQGKAAGDANQIQQKDEEKIKKEKKIAEESVIKYQFLIQSKIMTDR